MYGWSAAAHSARKLRRHRNSIEATNCWDRMQYRHRHPVRSRQRTTVSIIAMALVTLWLLVLCFLFQRVPVAMTQL